jgi:hypothetical protein
MRARRATLVRAIAQWPPLRSRALRAASGWTLAACAAAGAWALGVPSLQRHASVHRSAAEVEVRLVGVPPWAAGELEQALLATARRSLSGDPFARDDLLAARTALLATGWLEDVPQVRRITPGLVEIQTRFARPYAVARQRSAGRDDLLDDRGRILPRSFPSGSARLPVIVGARVGAEGQGLRTLDAADFAAAFAVLELVGGRPWRHQVSEVHLHHDGGIRISLLTDRGCRIVWGRPPDREAAAEVSASRKLKYLDYHHEHYGHIDRGVPRELDITGDVVVGR